MPVCLIIKGTTHLRVVWIIFPTNEAVCANCATQGHKQSLALFHTARAACPAPLPPNLNFNKLWKVHKSFSPSVQCLVCVCVKSPSQTEGGRGVKNPYITLRECWVTERGYRKPDTGDAKGVETSFYSCESSRELMMTGKNHVRVGEAVHSFRTKLRLF